MSTNLRPFRNGDLPALAGLWNRGLPATGVARPLSIYDFDARVVDRLNFDPDGLIVAERDGCAVGFVHGGFGPLEPDSHPGRLDYSLGTLAMLVVDPERSDAGLERDLVVAGEAYLVGKGARVIYAGGQYPLNPFYWGSYGSSECSGVLSSHVAFHRAIQGIGYEPVGATALLELDLSTPEPRDPRAVLLRRQARLEVEDDHVLPSWWDDLALGAFHPTGFRLMAKANDQVVARAVSWEMCGFGLPDGRTRRGLIQVEVGLEFRRRGFGRLLIGEVCKHAREMGSDVLAVQTASTNLPALALYELLGFIRVETATLYRLRHDPDGRSPGTLP